MSKIIVLTSIWLVEWSPSLRSECMVLPYLKGFDINEYLKFCLLWWCLLGIFSISIHFLVRSTTSGIRALSWAEFGRFVFSLFCRKFLGGEFVEQIWKIWWKNFRNKYLIWIPYRKLPNFKKNFSRIGVRMRVISLI